MQIKTEIIINASQEKVWQVLTNLEEYSRWNPFIVRSIGSIAEGNTLTNTLKSGTGNMTFRPRVLKVEATTYFDWLGRLWVKGLFDGHHYFELKALGPDQVKLIHGEKFSGIFSGVIFRKIGEETRQNFEKMNAALKKEAEKIFAAEAASF